MTKLIVKAPDSRRGAVSFVLRDTFYVLGGYTAVGLDARLHALDLAGVATSFGFEHPPKVTLMVKANAKEPQRRKGHKGGKGGDSRGTGHTFSAENPYGRRGPGDSRQFSR